MMGAMSGTIMGFAFASEYVLRGALVGLSYGLLALGIVLVFRSSNIINFAHGEIGLFAAAAFVKFVGGWGIPYWIGFCMALICGASAGAVSEVVLVRRLRNAPRLMSVVATLGFGQVLAFWANVIQGNGSTVLGFPKPTGFPTAQYKSFFISQPFMAILILSPLVMVAIASFLRFSRIGIGIRAAAANPEAARMAGLPPGRMSAITWSLAGALSTYTALMVIPALGTAFQGTTNAPGLLLRALTVAAIARFASIPITLVAGLVVGMVESIFQFNYTNGGPIEVLLFAVAIVALVAQQAGRGRAARRDNWNALQPWAPLTDRLTAHPIVGRLGPIAGVICLIGAVFYGLVASNESATVGIQFLFISLLGLSVYLLTGIAGQLSLGQAGIAAIGAAVALRWQNGPGELVSSLVIAGLVGAVVSAILGIPALRVRGLMVAVTTLGFAIATRSWLSRQPWVMGTGLERSDPVIFGLDLATNKRFYWFALIVVVLAFLVVRNISGSGFGRTLIALRDNEDQARAMVVKAARSTMTVYALAGFIAATAGALYASSVSRIDPDTFKVDDSIALTAYTVLGGLGLIAGPFLGAAWNTFLPRLQLDSLGFLATSFGWLILLLYVPSGLSGLIAPLRRQLIERIAGRGSLEADLTAGGTQATPAQSIQKSARLGAGRPPGASDERKQAASSLMKVSNITKRFGGVTACDSISFDVIRGETLGLIGPNGAGKTTLFEIIGGFTAADHGSVEFDDVDVTRLRPEQRAQAGLVRSFQDAPLFGTLTVRDTIRLSHERLHPSTLRGAILGAPSRERRVASSTDDLIDLMGLSSYARKQISDLSTGTRRITELACLVAMEPKLLLLDEPASGIAQRETEALGDLLQSIKRHLSTTIILIEHDIPMVRSISDRILAMDSGRMITIGTPAEVLSHPQVVESYLGGDAIAIERSGVSS
jgi:ABC-type branched-subunit amino acid transport system ATPase component/ABC-type branched-subunit amino acid transport system permease subunit